MLELYVGGVFVLAGVVTLRFLDNETLATRPFWAKAAAVLLLSLWWPAVLLLVMWRVCSRDDA